MNPLAFLLTMVIVGLTIIDVAVSFARGRITGNRAVMTVIMVIILCIVASIIFF